VRSPHNTDSLEQLKLLLPEPIKLVIDVGIQYETQFLIECFPDAFHYLIEPVTIYHEAIVRKYTVDGIAHELVKSAVSDTEGLLYQHLQSLDGSGKVTHSQLLNTRNDRLPGLIDIVPTQVMTLDAIIPPPLKNDQYLIKIDVDGIEEKIIQGGKNLIQKAAVVVIEAPLRKLSVRTGMLESLGMELFDITDLCYYYNQLQQVDLIFVNQSITNTNLDFRPFLKYTPINWEQWRKH